MKTATLSATVEARVLPSCQHGSRAHRTVAQLLLCALPGSRWVRDTRRELEFPEMQKIAVVWCEGAAFSLYPDRHRALSAMRQASFRLCPAGYSCADEHRVIEIAGSQLAPLPGRAS